MHVGPVQTLLRLVKCNLRKKQTQTGKMCAGESQSARKFSALCAGRTSKGIDLAAATVEFLCDPTEDGAVSAAFAPAQSLISVKTFVTARAHALAQIIGR